MKSCGPPIRRQAPKTVSLTHSRIWRHGTRNPSLRPRSPGISLPMGSRLQSRPRCLSLRPKSTQDSPFRPGRHWHAREGPSATYSGRGPTRACRGRGFQGMAMLGARPLGRERWVCTGPPGWRGRVWAEGGSLPEPCRRDLEPEGAAGEGHLHRGPPGLHAAALALPLAYSDRPSLPTASVLDALAGISPS